MKKPLAFILKLVGGIVLTVVLLVVGAFFMLNTSHVQNYLLQKAVALLKDQLQTEVKADHLSVSFFGQNVNLYGVTVEDREHRQMLNLEELGVHVDLWRLMNNEVKVTNAQVKGLKALLLKSDSDSVANYQFVVDAFKKKKVAKDSVPAADTTQHKRKLTFDVDRVWLERINVHYNQHNVGLGTLLFRKGSNGRLVAEITDLQTKWVQKSKRGPVDTEVHIGAVNILDMKDYRMLTVNRLRYVTDNNKPRKNVEKPKRGFFDVGHFDLTANMTVKVTHIAKDSVVAHIDNFNATDSVSGIYLRQLKADVEANKQVAHLKRVSISLPQTTLKFDQATLQLPSKKQGRKLTYKTSLITGTTVLQDISRAFAPVLKNFQEPLQLQTRLVGDDEGMRFDDVRVNSVQKDLNIRANGFIRNLKDKYKMQVHFDIHQLKAAGGSKSRLINQFTGKKFMMKQLHNLGTIGYRGSFDVLWKLVRFRGLLTSAVGNLGFTFDIDGKDKYLNGTIRTDSLELGRAMEVPGLGMVACKADFKFDISKPRTAIMRRKVGGKLPMGVVNAEVSEAKYKMLHVRNTVATIKSNGAVAEGQVNVRGKRLDVVCSFSFTNTNEMQKMKIKPGLKFHGLSTEAQAEKEAKKQQKAALKQQKAEEKAAEKAARKAAKEAAKEEKKARKEEKKARKAEEKARKAAEKAARKAAKEASLEE